MPDTVDELQIKINAEATKANNAIDALVGKLDRLTTSLGKINGTNLNGLANGVQRLGNAMQVMNTIKTSDFTRLATNLTKLGTVNVSALNSAASSMSHLTRAFNGIVTVSANAQAVGDMAKNIAKLGNKSVQTAITNIPQLAKSLNGLMTTLSKSPKVSQNVIQMTNAIASLASQGSKVGSASNSIARGLNRTTTTTKKASGGFKGLASSIGRFYATYFMAIRGLKGLWKSIESTADYIEAYNYFNVSLGKIGADWSHQYEQYGYESAESYAESFKTRLSDSLKKLSGVQVSIGADGKGLLTESGMKNLGLNIQEITQYASQLASVTNSVGQTGETSLAIAKNFTRLAGDISSLFNVDYSAVSKNLQSGLIGQSRALYKYGIDITNATLQTYAYNLGLSKSVSEMTQAEKMQLRMIAILDQSKVSWGDLANTINSPSNMIRQFKNNAKETGMVLGQLFIPALQKVLPIINGAPIAFKRLLTDIAGFLNINIDLDSFGQGYTDMEDDVDEVTDSYEDATKAAKEWKNQLLGFDEVNKLAEDSSADTNGAGNGSFDLTNEILAASSEYEKVWNKAYEQMENQALKIADKIEKAFEPIKNIGKYILQGEMYKAGSSLAELINNGIEKHDWGKVGTYIGKRITGTFDFVAGFAKTLNWKGLAKQLTSFLNSGINAIKPESVADAVNSVVNGILDFAITFVEEFDWGKLVSTIGKILKDLDWVSIGKLSMGVAGLKLAKSALVTFGKTFSSGFASIINTGAMTNAVSMVGSGLGSVLAQGIKSPLMAIPAATALILDSFIKDYEDEYEEALERTQELMRDKTDESVKEYADKMKSAAQEISDSMASVFDSANGKVSDSFADMSVLDNMADKYFKLAEKQGKSNEEIAEMNALHDGIIDKWPDLKDVFDKNITSIDKQKAAVKKYIDEYKKKIKLEAMEDALKEQYKIQYKTLEKLTKAEEEYSKAKDVQDKKLAKYKSARSAYYSYMTAMEKEYDEAVNNGDTRRQAVIENEMSRLKTLMDNAGKELEVAQHNYQTTKGVYKDLEDVYKQSEEKVEYYTGQITTTMTQGGKSVEGFGKSFDKIPGNAENGMGKANSAISSGMGKAKKSVSDAQIQMVKNWDKLPSAVKNEILKTHPEWNKLVGYAASASKNASKKVSDNLSWKIGNNIGYNFVLGLGKGLRSEKEWKEIQADMTKKGLVVPTSLIKLWDIHSPSKLAKRIGKYYIEGLGIGLSDWDYITKNVSTMGNDISTTAEKSLSQADISNKVTKALSTEFGKVELATVAGLGVEQSYYNAPSYNSSIGAVYDNMEEIQLLREQTSLLMALLNKEQLVISPDADGIFKMVQGKANNYTRQTGTPAFLV